jgi:hypothetical protein
MRIINKNDVILGLDPVTSSKEENLDETNKLENIK